MLYWYFFVIFPGTHSNPAAAGYLYFVIKCVPFEAAKRLSFAHQWQFLIDSCVASLYSMLVMISLFWPSRLLWMPWLGLPLLVLTRLLCSME